MDCRVVTEDLNKAALAREAEERGYLYGLLAALFQSEPDGELLAKLATPEFLAALAHSGARTECLRADGADGYRDQETLALEYTQLFIGPGRHVSPHEAVHLPEEGGHMGESSVAVRHFIESSGMAYQPSYPGMPDHLSVELEFMQHLASAEAQALRRDDEAQRTIAVDLQGDFLRRHLGEWLPSFAARVRAQAQLGFYAELAELAARFVASELETLRQSSILARNPSKRSRGTD